MLRPLKTHCFVRIGYLNQTSLNSIVPLNDSVISIDSLGISIALIYVGVSIILNTLVAAITALPTSGP